MYDYRDSTGWSRFGTIQNDTFINIKVHLPLLRPVIDSLQRMKLLCIKYNHLQRVLA